MEVDSFIMSSDGSLVPNPSFTPLSIAQVYDSTSSSTSASDIAFNSRKFVYFSYALSAWGDQMFDFASIVFVAELFPDTLFYASLLGCLETLTVILSGPKIGHFIDSNARILVIKWAIFVQNIFIFLAALFFVFAFENSSSASFWYIGIVFCACLVKVAATTAKLAFGKDWVVALCGQVPEHLTIMNGTMRQIDLSCAILAPLGIGVIAGFLSSKWTMLLIGIWSLASYFVEYRLVIWVSQQVPSLDKKNVQENENTTTYNLRSLILHYIDSWKVYISHSVFYASISYALLFTSLLNFHGPMTAFLKIGIGLDDFYLSLCRGIGAIIGMLGTIMLPTLIEKYGLLKSAFFTLWSQLLSLTLVLLCFVLPVGFLSTGDATLDVPVDSLHGSQLVFLIMMLAGISISRFGLWGFDMAHGQIMQEYVEADKIGVINGTQESLCNIMELLSFSLSLIFSNPHSFFWPVLISYASVGLSALFFTYFCKLTSGLKIVN